MDSYVRMFADNAIYSAKVTIKLYLNSAINTIKEKLSTTQLGMFEKTCFGHFLDMQELQFSGQVINHMLWRQCICDDPNIMVFNFGGSGARFTIQEFCLISGLFCGPVPTTRPTTSKRFRDTYFSGRKFPLHNHDIVEVFSTATCENDDDMVKLALLYFLETVILSKEKPTPIPVKCVDMLDDIKYFLTYPWGTLSYDATIKSMRGCPGKRSNASHVYSITGFPIAFMVWGYETIPSLAKAFGIKSPLEMSRIEWTISGMPKKKILEDIFAGRGVSILMLIGYIRYQIKIRQGNSVEDRLCAMEERLSSIDSRQSSIDSRLSSIDRKLDCLIKLLGGTYNTTGVQLDEDADQCFDEVGVQDIGVGDAHRTCNQRTDHAADDIVGPMSISSSPIVESNAMKVFTQMSDRKLAGGRRKRRAAHTIQSPYDCQSLRRKMIRTLHVAGSVIFDPYHPVPDEVARQYAHFMDTSTDSQTVELFWITVGKNYFRDMECSPNWLTSDHMETVTHLIRQRADKYPEVFDSRILVLDNRLSINNYILTYTIMISK
ncbi:hypothetical protein FNV43_RR22666 [Rhamnella rubrinervis]|uniref:DUF1985 domain-containing protein n=1 Tax=Rhamnella rubrinervis TaxID=2594499 RepID=A0A8K0E2D8_9ROSA|nr:hypothetical protein FNV43_RR22666 [Rhamnella rubrinervis]